MNKTASPKKSTRHRIPKVKVGEFDPAELLKSMHGLVDDLKNGRVHTLRTTTLPLPAPLPPLSAEGVRAVRDKLNVSQGLFAALLNVPKQTVVSWENNQRKPSGAALKLLDVVANHPDLFIVTSKNPS